MGDVRHLEGRRTGRRPGSRSRPAWRKAAEWAVRHFNDEGADPPSEFAKRLRDQARREPVQFLQALAALNEKADGGERPADAAPAPETASTRTAKVAVSLGELASFLMTGGGTAWASRLPQSFRVAGVDVDRRRRRAVLTISSPELVPSDDGRVPVLELD